jgi:hypothetical protein
LSLTASFEFVQVIQGRPALSPRGALALIQQSPLCTKLEIVDEPGACTVTMERTNGFSYTLTWTMADAEQASLVKPGGGWEKYPANMLRWRAVGFCADVVFPDIIGGMKRADELGADITPDGNVISGEWTVTEAKPESKAPEPETPKYATLEALMANWTPDQIMGANGGQIPATEAECQAVAEKLGAES